MFDYYTFFQDLQTVSGCLNQRDHLLKSQDVQELKARLAEADTETKKILGKQLNTLRQAIKEACDRRIQEIQAKQDLEEQFETFDPTFFCKNAQTKPAYLHPISLVTKEIVEIFYRFGFDVFEGEQVERQWYNFTTVGTPDYHPARSMQDTFFLEQKDQLGENLVMRTQVTANIARYAEKHPAPFRVIFPGIAFRAENIDATHDINFHQFDMWLVDRQCSLSQLVTLIRQFFQEFFQDPDLQVRLRPSYFPFTQPSFEGDIFCKWFKGGQWIEVFGAGPIHRQVLKNIGLDPQEWQGLAFGFGLTRLAQLKFQVTGLDQFYSGNLNFLKGV